MKTKRVTVTELAEIGKVSRTAIYKAVAAKKLTFRNGSADPLQLAREWARKRDAAQEDKLTAAIERGILTLGLGKSAGLPKSAKSAPQNSAEAIPEAGGEVSGESYASVRARREAVRTELALLDLGIRKGNLLEKSEVLAAWTGMQMECRAQLLSIGARVAYQVAKEHDPRTCQQIIDQRIRTALEILSRYQPGAEETAPATEEETADVR